METFKTVFKYFILTCCVSAGALVAVMVLLKLINEVVEPFQEILK